MSDNNAYCSVCSKKVEENAPVLAYGAYGIPRLLCADCESDLDTVTTDSDVAKIREAMRRLGERMTANEADDLTVGTMNGILSEAADRAKRIESGEYDPEEELDGEESDDENGASDSSSAEDGELDEIPEELLETEEDRALDEEEKRKQAKFDKIFNVVAALIFIAALGFVAYRLISGLL